MRLTRTARKARTRPTRSPLGLSVAGLGPDDVTVDVARSIVTLGGRLALRSLIPLAVRLTAVDGVIDVVD